MGFLIFITILFGSFTWVILRLLNFFVPNFMEILASQGYLLPYIFAGIVMFGLFGIVFGRSPDNDN